MRPARSHGRLACVPSTPDVRFTAVFGDGRRRPRIAANPGPRANRPRPIRFTDGPTRPWEVRGTICFPLARSRRNRRTGVRTPASRFEAGVGSRHRNTPREQPKSGTRHASPKANTSAGPVRAWREQFDAVLNHFTYALHKFNRGSTVLAEAPTMRLPRVRAWMRPLMALFLGLTGGYTATKAWFDHVSY